MVSLATPSPTTPCLLSRSAGGVGSFELYGRPENLVPLGRGFQVVRVYSPKIQSKKARFMIVFRGVD